MGTSSIIIVSSVLVVVVIHDVRTSGVFYFKVGVIYFKVAHLLSTQRRESRDNTFCFSSYSIYVYIPYSIYYILLVYIYMY